MRLRSRKKECPLIQKASLPIAPTASLSPRSKASATRRHIDVTLARCHERGEALERHAIFRGQSRPLELAACHRIDQHRSKIAESGDRRPRLFERRLARARHRCHPRSGLERHHPHQQEPPRVGENPAASAGQTCRGDAPGGNEALFEPGGAGVPFRRPALHVISNRASRLIWPAASRSAYRRRSAHR